MDAARYPSVVSPIAHPQAGRARTPLRDLILTYRAGWRDIRLAALCGAHAIRVSRLARSIGLHVACALGMCVAWAGLGTLLRLAIFPVPPDLTGPKVT